MFDRAEDSVLLTRGPSRIRCWSLLLVRLFIIRLKRMTGQLWTNSSQCIPSIASSQLLLVIVVSDYEGIVILFWWLTATRHVVGRSIWRHGKVANSPTVGGHDCGSAMEELWVMAGDWISLTINQDEQPLFTINQLLVQKNSLLTSSLVVILGSLTTMNLVRSRSVMHWWKINRTWLQ